MITIARFKQIVEGLLYYVEEDYQTVPEEQTLLYQMFYGVTDRNFDFYEQAKAIFTRRNTSPRKVIATMEFPKDKTHFPCIVIREPGRWKGTVDPFGGFGAPPLDEFGNDPYRREGFVNSNRSDVQLMCLSDNMLESILIGEVLWTLLIGARNTLEQEFVRFSFNAEDLIAQNDLFPLPILIKTISVEIEDVNRYASIIRPELITKFVIEKAIPVGSDPGWVPPITEYVAFARPYVWLEQVEDMKTNDLFSNTNWTLSTDYLRSRKKAQSKDSEDQN